MFVIFEKDVTDNVNHVSILKTSFVKTLAIQEFIRRVNKPTTAVQEEEGREY